METVNPEAEQHYKVGLELLHVEKYEEAIASFSRAIAIDPDFADAYHYRGELLTMRGRLVEGNADLEKAKALRSGLVGMRRNKSRTVEKINLRDADCIYDRVFPVDQDTVREDTVDFDSEMYDYAFSDDNLETGRLLNGLINTAADPSISPAILDYLGGRREEVFKAQLFQPSPEEITIFQEEAEESRRIVPLRELCCIRLVRAPSVCTQTRDDSCKVEIIETRDGNIYHEYIHPEQTMDGVLLAFSTKEATNFPYAFFPQVNIRMRAQQRYLGDILLEKRFIAEDILINALEEHQSVRNMLLGRIISRQANIQYSVVETTLANAERGGLKGLKTGEILVNSGLVNEDQVLDALDYQEKMQHKKLGKFLVEKGILREKELYISLAEKFRIPFVDLRRQKVSKKVLKLLPRELVLKFKILPIALEDSTLVVATATPDVLEIKDALKQYDARQKIDFVLVQPTHLKNVVSILYQDRRQTDREE